MKKLLSKIWVWSKWLTIKKKNMTARVAKFQFESKKEVLLRFVKENNASALDKLLNALSPKEKMYKELRNIGGARISFPLYSITQSAEVEEILFNFGARLVLGNEDSKHNFLLILLHSKDYAKIERFVKIGLKISYLEAPDLNFLVAQLANSLTKNIDQEPLYLNLIKAIISRDGQKIYNQNYYPAIRYLIVNDKPSFYEPGGLFDILLPVSNVNYSMSLTTNDKTNAPYTLLQLAIYKGCENFIKHTIAYYSKDIEQLRLFHTQIKNTHVDIYGIDVVLQNKSLEIIKNYIDKILLEKELPVVVVPLQNTKRTNKI